MELHAMCELYRLLENLLNGGVKLKDYFISNENNYIIAETSDGEDYNFFLIKKDNKEN